MEQLVARSTEVKERLRQQPLTCVSLFKPQKPAPAQQGSTVPTEDELRVARAALRQTMVAKDAEAPRRSIWNSASIAADAPDDATRASSVWSDSPPQHKHWSCQNVMLPIPASTGTVSASLSGSDLISTPPATAKPSSRSAEFLSPAQGLPLNGAELADAWIRSPAGEEFMAAVVAAEAKAEHASCSPADIPAPRISHMPTQPVSEAQVPCGEQAKGDISFSFGPALVTSTPTSESPGGGADSDSVHQGPSPDVPVRQSPLAVNTHTMQSPGPQSSALHAADSAQASRAARAPCEASELAVALAEVKRLLAVVSEVQQLLPQPDAPQALVDVQSFVAEVRQQMQAKPIGLPHLTPPGTRSASAPGSMSLLQGLGGRGLGKGKGLCLFGGRSSSACSSGSTPAASGMPSATTATASATSIRHSQTKVCDFDARSCCAVSVCCVVPRCPWLVWTVSLCM